MHRCEVRGTRLHHAFLTSCSWQLPQKGVLHSPVNQEICLTKMYSATIEPMALETTLSHRFNLHPTNCHIIACRINVSLTIMPKHSLYITDRLHHTCMIASLNLSAESQSLCRAIVPRSLRVTICELKTLRRAESALWRGCPSIIRLCRLALHCELLPMLQS